jgi:chondroitin 4-sulfotransferase 11
MINHKYKFAYLGAGKCGSSSIARVLRKLPGTVSSQHSTMASIYKNSDYGLIPNNYFTFTFCRNPFDRLVSAWYEFKKEDEFLWAKKSSYWNQQSFKDSNLSLEEVLENFCKFAEYTAMQKHIHWCRFDELNDMVQLDFIGRFENLEEDFNVVCDKIGIPRQELPHLNKSKRKHYSEYYDDKTRQIVAKHYAKDIECSGYEFGG